MTETTDRPDLQRVLAEMSQVVVGQGHLCRQLVVAMLSGGHVLLEGVPGVAKTLAVSTFAKVIGGSFSRIQFTPDLVPSDIVGTRIFRQDTGEFMTEPGPVMANVVLADEINRAPAKVQSALLEVMAEHQVSIAGRTRPVPEPFLVLATQNPIENQGVYPLPEAQRDRFLFKVVSSTRRRRRSGRSSTAWAPRRRPRSASSIRPPCGTCRSAPARCSSTTRSSTTSSPWWS